MPSHFGSYILSHSKRLMNDVIKQTRDFFEKNVYYTDTDSLYIHKKYWSSLAENGFVGISLGLNETEYGNSGTFYAWFLAPKIKYCLVIDNFGVILAKRTFEGFSEEQRNIKLNEIISFSERKTVAGRFLINWTKTLERTKIRHRKQDCLDCDDGKTCCSEGVIKLKMNCFNCEMERTCEMCLERISQKKNIFYRY